jgi:Ca-activated chloride channel family protein
MKFAEPIWLIAGLAVIAGMLALYRHFDLRQRAALAEFASSHLLAKLTSSFSPGRRRLKRTLFLAALAFIFLALARPQWGYHWQEEKDRGIDILFAIDTSKSMLTQDVTPDRLTRAKLATIDFVRKLDGDRVGLIAFAGEAFLQAPLTLDYDAFGESLDAIDTNTIPRGGTDISSAIEEAQSAFGPSTQNKKILVLITDGEDLEARGIDAARAAAKDGMVIYTVGVGSPAGGLIPVPNANGGTDFVKDAAGEYVKSHLDESTLKQIAEATGGIYEPLGQQGQGLQTIYDKALASLPKHELASKREKVYEERFQWPLAAGLLLLFASLLIGTRRSDRRNSSSTATGRAATATAAVLALMAIPTLARASAQSAESAYKKGDYNAAQSQYEAAAAKHPDAAPLQYNLGASAYKTGEYQTALPAFQKALGSDDLAVQQQTYYDLGNTQYRVGQKTEKSNPQDTMKTWQTAVQSYDAALKLKPDDADAKFNRDFVQKKLQQLQKQNQQKQDQKDKNQQNTNQQNQQDQNQQNQNQQNQQNQKQDQQNQPNQSGSGSKDDQQNKDGGQQKQDQNGQGNDQKQSSQDQAQNGKPGQQPKDQKNGQQQTAANKDQKPQGDKQDQPQNGNGDQQKQTAQNDQKPNGQNGQAGPTGKDQDKQGSEGSEAESAPPGQLTKEEAKELLNSLKNGEHALPVTADARTGNGKPQDEPVLKDW